MTNKLTKRKTLLISDDCKAALITFELSVRFHLAQESESVARNDAKMDASVVEVSTVSRSLHVIAHLMIVYITGVQVDAAQQSYDTKIRECG